ncbi:MAG: FecR family protein [Candidatus Eisenbacteria bacterium]
MTHQDGDLLSPAQERVRAVLLALPQAEADSHYRAQLRARFTQGDFKTQPDMVVHMPALQRAAWVTPLLAVAACLVLAVMTFNQAPAWQVTRARGAGAVLVGNRIVPLSSTAMLSAALAHGGRVRLPAGGELELVAPGNMAMSLAEGSEVVIPRAPGRWFARSVHADVRSGEAFITTALGFHGSHLTVSTPEATVEVVGTTFAVLRHPEGTCVCVMEGRVRVGAVGEPMVEVGAGLRRFCYPHGSARASESAPILGYSEHALHELRASTEQLLEH